MKSPLDRLSAAYAVGVVQGAVLAFAAAYSSWLLWILSVALGASAYVMAHAYRSRDEESGWGVTVRCEADDCERSVTAHAPTYEQAERLIEDTLDRMGWVGDLHAPFADRAYLCQRHRPEPEPIDWYAP